MSKTFLIEQEDAQTIIRYQPRFWLTSLKGLGKQLSWAIPVAVGVIIGWEVWFEGKTVKDLIPALAGLIGIGIPFILGIWSLIRTRSTKGWQIVISPDKEHQVVIRHVNRSGSTQLANPKTLNLEILKTEGANPAYWALFTMTGQGADQSAEKLRIETTWGLSADARAEGNELAELLAKELKLPKPQAPEI